MKTCEFDYELPKELIAKYPAENRCHSRMMVLNREDNTISHKKFFNFVEYFDENDLIVFNDTRVIPARLLAKRQTGAKIEIFLHKQKSDTVWECLLKNAGKLKPGEKVTVSPFLMAAVLQRQNDGTALVEFFFEGNFLEIISKCGLVPLPPYIRKELTDEEFEKLDKERYQTVFSKNLGSVAAPTAGLHFTDEIINTLKNKGTQIAYVTLDVGLGTFKPVDVDDVESYKIHSENYEISSKTANLIQQAKNEGKRITAVGTTTVRTLEDCMKKHNKIIPTTDSSELFIYPPYSFKIVDRVLTNFHLPKSTLLMLISAFATKDFIKKSYQVAIDEQYRFYSFGDCMFIL